MQPIIRKPEAGNVIQGLTKQTGMIVPRLFPNVKDLFTRFSVGSPSNLFWVWPALSSCGFAILCDWELKTATQGGVMIAPASKTIDCQIVNHRFGFDHLTVPLPGRASLASQND